MTDTPVVRLDDTGPVTAPAENGGREAAIARGRNVTSLLLRNGAVVALALVVVLGLLIVPTFGSADNFRNVALAASFLAIISAGMTFVIISGGIDLSVGSTYALAVILSAQYSIYGSAAAILVPLLSCAFVGVVQGVIVAYTRLPAFIVTLAGLGGVRGIVFFITDEGNSVPRVPGSKAFEALGTGALATIGTPVWIALAVFGVGWLVLNRTAFGQNIQAIGGNTPAAELMGLPVRRATTLVYVISGLCAGIAGILTTAQSGGGQEARIGDSYELQAIAAVVIGGTLLAGGVGSILGSLAGISLLFVIQNLIVQGANLNSYVQQVVSGAFLLVVVVVQATISRRVAPPGT
ncbi:ribose transport system permease protein [Jatrophihabitans endophyticus]|uniref:Ribose transport system permease protein n=1 Tax=Jatrophihabitans endophyticus TaxID=1206085 RepID=A0A1M5DMP3_9ACTN|nr:ABC transporter permease [Jatrophihabitans endophyticus]SHF68243.1 ribose transport system permease protein [Jatrophihabitans endophyticus]